MVKDEEDYKRGLQNINLKNLGWTFQDAQIMTYPYKIIVWRRYIRIFSLSFPVYFSYFSLI